MTVGVHPGSSNPDTLKNAVFNELYSNSQYMKASTPGRLVPAITFLNDPRCSGTVTVRAVGGGSSTNDHVGKTRLYINDREMPVGSETAFTASSHAKIAFVPGTVVKAKTNPVCFANDPGEGCDYQLAVSWDKNPDTPAIKSACFKLSLEPN